MPDSTAARNSDAGNRGQPRVLVLITRGTAGGAQVHVRDLVIGLRNRFDLHVGVGERGMLTEALEQASIPLTILPSMQREIHPRRDRRALGELRDLIRRLRPDLVHTHSSKAGILGRVAARLEGVTAMHTAHAWSFSDGIPWRRKALTIPVEALVGRSTERFVVVSEADRQVGLRYGVARPSQLRVIHNGVQDTPHRAAPEAEGPPVITMVARLAAPKQPRLLLQALSRLETSWRLQLVGDGPDRPQVQESIRDLGLEGRVSMLGSRRDVPELLAGSQLFVLASRQEGFPLSILEAMRAGLPVVASDVGGVAEAVQHGRTGFLVPRDDLGQLCDALRRLLVDPTLRQQMGAAGRRVFEARFHVHQMVSRTADVYRELLPSPGRGAGSAEGSHP